MSIMEGKVFYIGTIFLVVIFFTLIYGPTIFRTDEVNQSIVIPLKIHKINDLSGIYSTQRDEQNIRNLIEQANRIWSQAGIVLEIRDIVSTDVNAEDIQVLLSNRNTGYLETLGNFDPETINVFLSSSLDGVNGIAFSSRNSIMVADTTTVNDFRTTAHEIGHVLGLDHVDEYSSLMARGKNGEFMLREEVQTARGNARMFG